VDIPVNVDVYCTDGLCGRSTYVLINPVRQEVTHLVVMEADAPQEERVVSTEIVSETTPDMIMLDCTKDQLERMASFNETEYIREPMQRLVNYMPSSRSYGFGSTWMWPYFLPERTETVAVEHHQIPPGELAIRRGTGVDATDGHVGRVDEFLVNPDNEHITHLVMREGHLWGQKDVTIPVSAIDHFDEDTVYLKLDKDEIEALPTIRIQRK
jgi:hypothetical protein